MSLPLELKDRAASGRICTLDTPHGRVTTPTLLPVINPNINLFPAKEMRAKFGTQMVITNSYVIRRGDELRERALSKGVHDLLDWDGPVMTDSGTFQQYVYGDDTIALSPDEVIDFQRDIGVDVGTVLDVFSTPDRTFREAMEDVEETSKRIEAAAARKGDMALAATVQGGVHPILREEAAERAAPFGDLFPIGGVVPLMEQQRYADLARAIIGAKKGLPAGSPVHLFGCGHPMVFPMAVALGCDLFDSSAYAKYARDGRVIFPDGTRHLAEIDEWEAVSPITADHTPGEIQRMDKKTRQKLLAEHNLYVCFAELRRIRQAIRDARLWELVEQRATAHPSLLDALNVLQEEPTKVWLETQEPVAGSKALLYTGPNTIHRPIIHRIHQRLRNRYRFPRGAKTLIVFDEGTRPFAQHLVPRIKTHLEREHCHFIIDSHLGPVPIELDEMYPFAQSAVPGHIDGWSRHQLDGVFSILIDEGFQGQVLRDGDELEDWGFHTQDELYADPELLDPPKKSDGPGYDAWNLDLLRVRALADMQFGRGAADVLFGPEGESTDSVTFKHSRKTGKLRNVFVNGEHVVSMRATEGLFSLNEAGARRLHGGRSAPQNRVQVNADSAPYNGQGRNVIAPFVESMDPALRPGDDCIVVDPEDRLLAHGRVMLAPHEVHTFERGVAVRVREGLGKEKDAEAATAQAA